MSKYLDLLKYSLSGALYPESYWIRRDQPRGRLKKMLVKALNKRGLVIVLRLPMDLRKREYGEDWPMVGYTMIGHRRLDNIRYCLTEVVKNNIPGDFVETGVWRGGASIYARAVLNELGATDRTVWLADSFEGMPGRTEQDMADPELSHVNFLAVSQEEVAENFRRFDLLGDNVRFLKGWFSETLHKAPIRSISVLRLDGDYYESTMDALNSLYDKIAENGFVIVDDYEAFHACKKAVHDFLEKRAIRPEINRIDNMAVYWQVSHTKDDNAPSSAERIASISSHRKNVEIN